MRISDWSSDVCSSDLSGAMATPKITGMIRRKARRDAKGGVPAVGDLRQRRVERFAQTRDDLRQRIGEVAVLAAAEAVTCHDDAAAEQRAILEIGRASCRARVCPYV